MKPQIAAAILAMAVVCSASAAPAATLGLTTDAPGFSSSTSRIDFLALDTDGDLSTYGARVDFSDGVTLNGFTEIGFGIGFTLTDPTVGASGGFDVNDEEGLFLGGDLFAVGFTEKAVELQFNNLSGSGSGFFGSSVLMLIAFDEPLGPNPFASFFDGDSLGASITISNVTSAVAAIPLPSGLPLMLTGMLGMRLIARRRARRLIGNRGDGGALAK